MVVPTYDEFVKTESWDVERAYRESRGHPPAISDMYHNAYRRLIEGWSHDNIIRDIKGQSISNGPAPTMPPAPSPAPPTDEPTSVPTSRGPFQFPAPYNTRAIRITDAGDGPVYPCGYSYWSRINNHRDRGELLVLVGLKNHGPSIYRVDKGSHQVTGPHSLFAEDAPLFADEADQWYFSATEPTAIYACSGRKFLRIDAITSRVDVVFETKFGDSVFQPHSSDDGRVHSATVKDAEYHPMGCVVWRDGQQTFYRAQGDYDECQIDSSGRWLIIKESDDNRIVDLSGQQGQRIIRNADGALGHSDCGWGFAVGEDDMHQPPGRMVQLDLTTGEATLMYGLDQWTSGLGHVAVRDHLALVSNAHRENLARVNDLIVVTLDGSQQWRAVAPNLVDLNASGGGSDYKKQPMANLDPLAQYACWSSNHGSDRLDIFLVQP